MTILATDNFNRANADPIGNPWTSAGDGGQFKIVSNAATPNALGSDCSAFENTVTWPNDQYSQAKVTVTGTDGGGRGIGVGVRMATNRNYYRLAIDHASSNNVRLNKKVNGTSTQIWLRTVTLVDGDTLYLEVQGTTLIAKLNGVEIGASATDSSLSSGAAGICYSSTATSASEDDWEGGDFSSADTLFAQAAL